jgi:hypothetical protein
VVVVDFEPGPPVEDEVACIGLDGSLDLVGMEGEEVLVAMTATDRLAEGPAPAGRALPLLLSEGLEA